MFEKDFYEKNLCHFGLTENDLQKGFEYFIRYGRKGYTKNS